MMHLLDYRRDVQSNMTVCGLVVGDEFIAESVIGGITKIDFPDLCVTCSQLQFRRDEPEMPIPNVEGMPVQKEERYGD